MSAYDHALFYNSNNGDRVYDADSFEFLLKRFFTTGVFAGDCAVSPVSGMKIKMGTGYCNIGGKVRFFENDTEFTLATAHSTYGRIDTVVIERNDSDRDITAKVVTGTPGANPSATAPVRSGAVYQIVVAEIAVAAGAVGVTAINITDKRIDTSVCGLVASTVTQADFADLYAQFTAAFNEWFDEMKDQLSEDAAGNLQNEIDDLDNEVVKHSAQTLTDAQKSQARENIGIAAEDISNSIVIEHNTSVSETVEVNAYKQGDIISFRIVVELLTTITPQQGGMFSIGLNFWPIVAAYNKPYLINSSCNSSSSDTKANFEYIYDVSAFPNSNGRIKAYDINRGFVTGDRVTFTGTFICSFSS